MTTPAEIQSEAIRLLHFDPKWFEFGMVPLGFFEQQIDRFQKVLQHQGEDDTLWENPDHQVEEDLFWASLEHHRYAAFQSILAARERMSDAELEHYIELCELDEDQGMSLSALVNLLSWQGVTGEQYERIIRYPAFSNPVAQKIIWRNKMSQRLLRDGLSDEEFSEVLSRQDPVFERKLVEATNLSPQQLEVMAEKGISRAVRNIAKSRLKRRD